MMSTTTNNNSITTTKTTTTTTTITITAEDDDDDDDDKCSLLSSLKTRVSSLQIDFSHRQLMCRLHHTDNLLQTVYSLLSRYYNYMYASSSIVSTEVESRKALVTATSSPHIITLFGSFTVRTNTL